ncbi:MAG TPA: penicillin-binding protein [Lentisphaeria bacterium]|nr:MAG: hypothetical protein A2X48_06240 [Lentisphaerae bacterium GWF2_49_21]HBC87888.1 penicillin-binding protein [Lentisphaeria bacterium]
MTLPKSAEQPASVPEAMKALQEIRDKYDLPALGLVVVKDGKVCDRAAVGIRKTGNAVPVATSDKFHIGSCTKSMTATIAAMLIEEGRLRWNTTVAEVFPELTGEIHRQCETVRLEQLLTHRGGIANNPDSVAWSRAWEENGTPTQQRYEFARAVLAYPLAVTPGTKMIYSNSGYAIVSAMIERAIGEPWEHLATEKLFSPLHMDSAGFGPPGTKDEVDQPWGHTKTESVKTPSQKDNPPAISAAGRVHCSLDDLALFAVFHVEGERQNGLLKTETMRKLHTPPAGSDYAFGWLCVESDWAGGKELWHNGSNTFWYASMWLAPARNFALVTATNIAGVDADKALDEVKEKMVRKWLSH